MLFFVKVSLIALFIYNVKGDLNMCDKEDDSEISGMRILLRNTVKSLDELNEKYHRDVNYILKDVDYIKSAQQTENMKSTKCKTDTSEQLTSEQHIQTTNIINPPSMYDKLWIIIQRRQEGSIDFRQSWYYYKHGFGNLFRDFFIGLEKLHHLTNIGPHELIIHLNDFKGNIKYAMYSEFLVGSESEKYQLKKLGNYSGNAGDYLRDNESMYFSTKDKDNDASDLNCAKRFEGGWWYNNCTMSNLNGPYRRRYEINPIGINWGIYNPTPIQVVQMMIRLKC